MSHEIRTPLNGVLGMAQSLQSPTSLNEAQIEKVNVILDSGKTLTALLNDVLDISKIEAGKIEIATDRRRAQASPSTACASSSCTRAVERGLNIISNCGFGPAAAPALRSGARAPVRGQPALQRHQVHRARPS